jgi:hypothetical protein
MRFPINRDYTDAQRLEACEVIFNVTTESWSSVCTDYWSMFVNGAYDSFWMDSGRSYLYLRQRAFEWFTNYRLEALFKTWRRDNPDSEWFI